MGKLFISDELINRYGIDSFDSDCADDYILQIDQTVKVFSSKVSVSSDDMGNVYLEVLGEDAESYTEV